MLVTVDNVCNAAYSFGGEFFPYSTEVPQMPVTTEHGPGTGPHQMTRALTILDKYEPQSGDDLAAAPLIFAESQLHATLAVAAFLRDAVTELRGIKESIDRLTGAALAGDDS